MSSDTARNVRLFPAELLTIVLTHFAGDLQCEGVILRSPSPVALEDRNPEELTPDELRQFMRNFQERREAEQRVKREHAVKRERPHVDECEMGSDRKRRRFAEHVDLTED